MVYLVWVICVSLVVLSVELFSFSNGDNSTANVIPNSATITKSVMKMNVSTGAAPCFGVAVVFAV